MHESDIFSCFFSFKKSTNTTRDVSNSLIFLSTFLVVMLFLIVFFYFIKYRTSQRDLFIAKRNPTPIASQFLREFWEWLTFPLFQTLVMLKVSPNQITLMSLFWAICSGFFFTLGHISTGGWLLIISGMLDTLDGRIARHKRIDSRAGAFFDSIIDRYSDYCTLTGIIVYFSIFDPSVGTSKTNAYLGILGLSALLGTHLISYSKERGANLGVTDNQGIMQRADRMIVLATATILDPLVYFAINHFMEEKPMNRYYGLGIGLLTISLFANITAVKRIKRNFLSLKKIDNKDN